MAGSSLKIDDKYCEEMGECFYKAGQELDAYINDYITILQNIRKKAIKTGKVAAALERYIYYAKKMLNQFDNSAKYTKTSIAQFLKKIDEADKYLY